MDRRIVAAITLSALLAVGIGFQAASGEYKSALSLLLLPGLLFLVLRLSPRTLVYIALFLVTIPTREIFKLGNWSVRLVDIFVPLAFLRLKTEEIYRGEFSLKFKTPFMKYFALFFVIGLISLLKVYINFGSRSLVTSGVSFGRFWLFSLVCVLIAGIIRNQEDLQRLVKVLAMIGIFHAAFGVLDSLLYHAGLKHWITAVYDFIGHDYSLRFIDSYRIGGLQFTPENLGNLLGQFLPFVLLAASLPPSRHYFWLLGLAAIGLSILEAKSRLGLFLVIYFCGGFYVLGKSRPMIKWGLLGGILILLYGVASSQFFYRRVADTKYFWDPYPQDVSRITIHAYKEMPDIWRDSFLVYKLHGEYILGSGWGTMDERFQRYAYTGSPLQSEVWQKKGMLTASNTYLQFLNDTGMLGLLAFAAGWILALAWAFRIWRKTGDVFRRNLALVIWLSLLAFIPQNMFGVILVFGTTYTITSIPWIYLGLLSALYGLEGQPQAAASRLATLGRCHN